MVMQLKLVMTWGFLLGLPYDMVFFRAELWELLIYWEKHPGWWFGTCLYIFYAFIYWEFHNPNWLIHIFRRGRSTTNQHQSGQFYHGIHQAPGPRWLGQHAGWIMTNPDQLDQLGFLPMLWLTCRSLKEWWSKWECDQQTGFTLDLL